MTTFALFSGGHDSLAATALAAKLDGFAGVLHIDTGTGIPETTEFVRETCRRRGWALTVIGPEAGTYERLVLERGGFPYGTQSHNAMLYYLKQRPLRAWLRQTPGPVELVTGIRRDESTRRAGAGIAVAERRDDRYARLTWLSPILEWSAVDVSRAIDGRGLERNQVVDLLHRSGECLCGALARGEEIHEIDRWFPEVGARIHALEARCEDAGLVACVWASRTARSLDAGQLGLFRKSELAPLCSSCEAS